MKFAELERQFVKISQKHRFLGVLLGCRLEVRRSPRLIFIQSGAIYRRIWPWGAPTAGDALSPTQPIGTHAHTFAQRPLHLTEYHGSLLDSTRLSYRLRDNTPGGELACPQVSTDGNLDVRTGQSS
jgi:hypothetical protein